MLTKICYQCYRLRALDRFSQNTDNLLQTQANVNSEAWLSQLRYIGLKSLSKGFLSFFLQQFLCNYCNKI